MIETVKEQSQIDRYTKREGEKNSEKKINGEGEKKEERDRHIQTYSHRDRFWHQLSTVERTLYSRLSAVVVVVVFVAAAAAARVYAPQRMNVK